jgi:hypothetical protein
MPERWRAGNLADLVVWEKDGERVVSNPRQLRNRY